METATARFSFGLGKVIGKSSHAVLLRWLVTTCNHESSCLITLFCTPSPVIVFFKSIVDMIKDQRLVWCGIPWSRRPCLRAAGTASLKCGSRLLSSLLLYKVSILKYTEVDNLYSVNFVACIHSMRLEGVKRTATFAIAKVTNNEQAQR